MTPTLKFLCIFVFIALFSYPTRSLQSKRSNRGFVFPIIHLNSLESPFHQPNATIWWKMARQHSMERRNYLLSSLMSYSPDKQYNSLVTPVFTTRRTEFLMKISIGTPPFETMAIVDTGSSETWFQCSDCVECYNQSSLKFDPSNSSTLRWVDCHSEECLSLSTPGCTINNDCTYRVWYGDKSTSYGKLASDTITMNSTSRTTIVFPHMLFGCGVENIGLWPLDGGGLVGLTGDETSLITQLGITRRFSYCFNAHWSTEGAGTGRLYLGRAAPLVGRRSPLSVLTARSSPASYYFVSLEDISVGSERLQVPRGTFNRKSDGSNGIVIDSGTSFTYLNSTALDMLIKKLKEVIKLEEVKNGSTPLCYNGTDEDLANKVPSVTFHFTNLDVRLPPFNTFAIFSPGSICLVMDRVDEGEFSVIGSYVQQNMNVGLDLEREVFTMAPADCTHLPV